MMGWTSAGERAAFIRKYFDLYEKSRYPSFSDNTAGISQREMQSAEIRDPVRTLAAMREEYEAHVPVLPLSRCPFTGRVVYHSIDSSGVDGLWWNYDAPVRPVESLPSRYLAFSGAMQIERPVEYSPFPCRPGPGRPFVLPRILNNEKVKAVLSMVPIGNHRGFPLFYFADPVEKGVGVTNDWGSAFWQQQDPCGARAWLAVTETEDEYDFALESWVRSGKLLWIAPGDQTMTLRTGMTGCPFTGLGGEEKNQRIQYGKMWTS
jgi:hypothetical protein